MFQLKISKNSHYSFVNNYYAFIPHVINSVHGCDETRNTRTKIKDKNSIRRGKKQVHCAEEMKQRILRKMFIFLSFRVNNSVHGC